MFGWFSLDHVVRFTLRILCWTDGLEVGVAAAAQDVKGSRSGLDKHCGMICVRNRETSINRVANSGQAPSIRIIDELRLALHHLL